MNIAEWKAANGYMSDVPLCPTCTNVTKVNGYLEGADLVPSKVHCLAMEEAGIPRGEATKINKTGTCLCHSAYKQKTIGS